MIINKSNYEELVNLTINHFNYVLLKFSINDNKVSSELVMLEEIKEELDYIGRNLYIVIYDRERYLQKRDYYLKYLNSIVDTELKNINKYELLKILSMLKENYPTFDDFLEYKEVIIKEILIIKESYKYVRVQIDKLQKKFNKLIDYSFTRNDIKHLEKYSLSLAEDYLFNYSEREEILEPTDIDEIEIQSKITMITEEIEIKEKKLEAYELLKEEQAFAFEIMESKKVIRGLKEERLELKKVLLSSTKRVPKTFKDVEKIKKDYLNSDEYRIDMEAEKNKLILKNINQFLASKEFIELKELKPMFIKKIENSLKYEYQDESRNEEMVFESYEPILKSNSDFEKMKYKFIDLLIDIRYKKHKQKYMNVVNFTPAQLREPTNIYSRFQREIITINLYNLSTPYKMTDEIKAIFEVLYTKSDKQFKKLSFTDDINNKILERDFLREEEQKSREVSIDFYKDLLSMGIDGNDWQEQANRKGIHIPYNHLLLDEESEFVDTFTESICHSEFSEFIEERELNEFNTRLKSIESEFNQSASYEELNHFKDYVHSLETIEEEPISKNNDESFETQSDDELSDFELYLQEIDKNGGSYPTIKEEVTVPLKKYATSETYEEDKSQLESPRELSDFELYLQEIDKNRDNNQTIDEEEPLPF